jgi:hypothetical protein
MLSKRAQETFNQIAGAGAFSGRWLLQVLVLVKRLMPLLLDKHQQQPSAAAAFVEATSTQISRIHVAHHTPNSPRGGLCQPVIRRAQAAFSTKSGCWCLSW